MTEPPPFNAGVTGNLHALEHFAQGCHHDPERARGWHRAAPGNEPGFSLSEEVIRPTRAASCSWRAHRERQMTSRAVIVVTEAIESPTCRFSDDRSTS